MLADPRSLDRVRSPKLFNFDAIVYLVTSEVVTWIATYLVYAQYRHGICSCQILILQVMPSGHCFFVMSIRLNTCVFFITKKDMKHSSFLIPTLIMSLVVLAVHVELVGGEEHACLQELHSLGGRKVYMGGREVGMPPPPTSSGSPHEGSILPHYGLAPPLLVNKEHCC